MKPCLILSHFDCDDERILLLSQLLYILLYIEKAIIIQKDIHCHAGYRLIIILLHSLNNTMCDLCAKYIRIGNMNSNITAKSFC